MKWKNVLLPAVTVFAAAGVLYHTLAPKGAVFSPGPVPAAESWALLPLDNRPPCRDFTEELGALGGIHFTAPPSEIMDWYDEPAHIPALKTWLAGTLPRQQGALLSTDLMIFGGLLHSRMEPLTDRKAGDFFTWLEELKDDNPDKQFYLYSIIPRLLISDHVLPDRWYQWHLMTWTINMDKKIRGLPYDRENYEEVKALIPMDLKWKYITLYRDNDRFNEELVQFVTEENLTDLVIGQDDAHPYGLPNYNRLNAGAYPQAYDLHPPIYTSQGADELGALAAARIYSRRTGYRPRIRVLYGDPAMKDYTLHFVPLTLGQIAEEKIRLANGTETGSLEDADFVLYIHCGGEKAARGPGGPFHPFCRRGLHPAPSHGQRNAAAPAAGLFRLEHRFQRHRHRLGPGDHRIRPGPKTAQGPAARSVQRQFPVQLRPVPGRLGLPEADPAPHGRTPGPERGSPGKRRGLPQRRHLLPVPGTGNLPPGTAVVLPPVPLLRGRGEPVLVPGCPVCREPALGAAF